MSIPFAPVARMRERANLALDDSDASYFLELLYLGELIIKVLLVEILAGLQDDRDSHRYALEFRALRAESIGGWAEVLDDAITGPASQHLATEARDSLQALSARYGADAQAWQDEAVNLLNEACRRLDPAHQDLSRHRVSLRQWVREFVWFRNRTRGHGATKTAMLSLVCPNLRDSINTVIDNAPAFQRSWAFLHQNLSGKYRISPFSGEREPFAFLTKEQGRSYSFSDGCYIYFDFPRRANLLYSDPDLIDFFLPNGNFRNTSFEVISYITDEVRTESGRSWMVPAEARLASETTAAPELEEIGNTFSNMPPRQERYIRRASLESDLMKVLLDDRHPVISLHGRGGVGKTSLALEVLHSLAHKGDFYTIVWFSARDVDLLSHGPKVVRADVLSKEDVARDFSALMGGPSRSSDAIKYFTDCLSGQSPDGPFVFVLDNFETIRNPAELYFHIDNAVRIPNKVLITTRTRDFKADYPIEVGGMNRDEFSRLVRETAIRLDIAHLVDSSYEEKLFEESDGHPYIAKVLLGDVAREGKALSPKRVVAAKDAMLSALFDRSFSALTSGAQRVFLTLCSWRSLVPRIGLEAILLRPANERIDIDHALLELTQMSLVEIIRDKERGDEFLFVPLAASVFGKKKLVTSPLKIAIEADLELIRGFGVTTSTAVASGVGLRVNRMARTAAERAERGEDVAQELGVLQYIATEHTPAWLTLAELHENQFGDLPAAIYCVTQYLESRPEDQDAWGHLIRLQQAVGDPVAEINARLQCGELGNPEYAELSSAANRLNSLLARRELVIDADEKRLLIRRLRLLMEARSSEADGTDLSRLAWLCLHDHDKESADRWVREGLHREPGNQYCLSLMQKLSNQFQSD